MRIAFHLNHTLLQPYRINHYKPVNKNEFLPKMNFYIIVFKMETDISEMMGTSVVILEQRDDYVLFRSLSIVRATFYVVNSNTMSWFSLRCRRHEIFTNQLANDLFRQCEILSNIEEILKYNFVAECDSDRGKITIANSPYYIHSNQVGDIIYIMGPRDEILEPFESIQHFGPSGDRLNLSRIQETRLEFNLSVVIISEFDVNTISVYDILDHPTLQSYRINHYKPVIKGLY